MANRDSNSRGSDTAEAGYIIDTARRIKKKVDDKADAYLEGRYDPGKEIRSHALKGVTTALVALSLLTGIAFSSPADVMEEQSAASYRPAPVVMDVSEFVNAPVDDDDDDSADEQKNARIGIIAKFRQAVLSLPRAVRLLIVMPLWLLGTGLMTMISFLWDVIFASPVGAFIASLAMGLLVLLGLFTATAKILFPDIPLRDLLSKRNLIILGITAVILSLFDAAAPMYWHSYPLAAALIKITAGGAVIGMLSYRTNRLISAVRQ